jgi:predicted nucleotidyltransferase
MQKISLIEDQSLPTSVKVQKILEQFKRTLQALYGEQLENIILFGSQARGEAHSDSDIDLLIVTYKRLSKKEREKLINLISDISINDDLLISFIEMLPSKFRSENSPLLINIRREGIIL